MKRTHLSKNGFILTLWLLSLLLVVLIYAASFLGGVKVTPKEILNSISLSISSDNISLTGELLPEEEIKVIKRHAKIFFDLRLFRILLAGLAGAGLALAGVVFQGIFRNPMADSYLLGVSSGASLGAALFFLIGGVISKTAMKEKWDIQSSPILSLLHSLGVSTAAFIGGLTAVGFVLLISGRQRGNITSLLLTGIAFGMIAQAGVSLMMIFNKEDMEQIVFWMMGSFRNGDEFSVLTLVLISIPSSLYILIKGQTLNLLSMGSEEAHSMGINPEKEGTKLLIIASLLTSAIVSFTGIIGFVGLLVPHGVRIFTGADNRRLLPLCLPVGAILMILSDLLARVVVIPNEIPVGIITAVIGGPVFLILLRSRLLSRSNQ